MTTVQPTLRPPELQLEGCIIEITSNAPSTPGKPKYRYRVREVSGPYPPDPNWYARPRIGGWTLVCEDLREGISGNRTRWINEVFVENGRIFAYPWRDEIVVIERSAEQQLSMF